MSNPDDFVGLKSDYLLHARALLRHMEENNDTEAERVLDAITKLRERSLFQELGKLTREFHEALNAFRLDSRIANIAENEIPDARQRLNYVIAMTEQSANRTLNAIETSMPVCDVIHDGATELSGKWEKFMAREMDAQEFRQVARSMSEFLAELPANADLLRNNLNEVLMAQDFQDLTGQIIRRVITLVEELEGNLVDLVRISGQNLLPKKEDTVEVEEEEEEDLLAPSGPPVPGVDKGTVSGQDEVDDLLSSLGF